MLRPATTLPRDREQSVLAVPRDYHGGYSGCRQSRGTFTALAVYLQVDYSNKLLHFSNKAVIDRRLRSWCCHLGSYSKRTSFSCRCIRRGIRCRHVVMNIQHGIINLAVKFSFFVRKYSARMHVFFRISLVCLVLSYLRTLTTWHCPHSPAACPYCRARAMQQSVVISARRAHSSKPAAAALLLWAHVGTDRPADTVQLHRPCSA